VTLSEAAREQFERLAKEQLSSVAPVGRVDFTQGTRMIYGIVKIAVVVAFLWAFLSAISRTFKEQPFVLASASLMIILIGCGMCYFLLFVL
jgi:hypothetical protein